MKLSTTILLLTISLAACDPADYTDTPAGLDGGVVTDALPAQDSKPATDTLVQRLEDAQAAYTAKGVYANLGNNRCYRGDVPSQGGGWDPNTAKCYTPSDGQVTSGLCGTYTCGVYAPGTILVWDSVNPRYRYWLGAGVVCLPNDVSYVVPCT